MFVDLRSYMICSSFNPLKEIKGHQCLTLDMLIVLTPYKGLLLLVLTRYVQLGTAADNAVSGSRHYRSKTIYYAFLKCSAVLIMAMTSWSR